MNIVKHRQKVKFPLRQVSLCFLLKNDEVLLALKKRGFGEGKINGVGGKMLEGETIEQTVIREIREEIDVIPKIFNKIASINFYFRNQPDWDQEVVVFLITSWDGNPKESEEVKPDWYKLKNIPYEHMWEDDIHWLPYALNGKPFKAEFLFDKNQKMIDKLLEFI